MQYLYAVVIYCHKDNIVTEVKTDLPLPLPGPHLIQYKFSTEKSTTETFKTTRKRPEPKNSTQKQLPRLSRRRKRKLPYVNAVTTSPRQQFQEETSEII